MGLYENQNSKDIHSIDNGAQLRILPMVSAKSLKEDPNERSDVDITSECGLCGDLVMRTASMKAEFVPPLNFSLVEDSIYRSGFPMPINYPFLKQLGLKTIIYLGDISVEKHAKKESKMKEKKDKPDMAEIMENYKKWIETTDITFYHLLMESSQEPFLIGPQQEQAQASLTKALQLMLDKSNFPILIHSNKGKHRIGVLVGLMRKLLQGWCMSGIFEEYEKFALGKSEFDLEFIELWQPELYYYRESKPEFVRI